MDIQDLAFETIARELGELRGKAIVDVGAGTGRLARRLAAGGAAVTTLDFAPCDPPIEGLAAAVVHDLNSGTLPFADASMDCVVSTEVLEHLRAPFLILSALVRILKPGGLLILTIPNYWSLLYRLRYLFLGSVQRPCFANAEDRAKYASGYAPHINVYTYPTLRTILEWDGCGAFDIRTARMFPFARRVGLAPLYALVRLFTFACGRARRAALLLDQTNKPAVLLGRRHVLLKCVKRSPA
jgi:SAM-dependent methyltransferase